MKFEYGVIAVVGFLVFSTISLIVNQPDDIPHWNYLQEIKQQEFEEGCNIDCKKEQEDKRGYHCTSLDSEQYICRPPRKIFYENEVVQIRTAFPPNYGEFAYIPEGIIVPDNKLFDIAKTEIINSQTKEIGIDFRFHNPKDPEGQFEYYSSLVHGQTFISHCLGGDSKTAHIVEYRDVFELDNTTYVEFWGTHVTMPDELLPCKMPELLHHSIPIDLSTGIDFDRN